MKKSWKKLLCSLMLAPCMFWATACGDDPEDPSNLTTDLTIEQQQEAYATLRTVAASVLNNDGTKDQSYVLENTKNNYCLYDLSHTGLYGDLLQIANEATENRDKTLDSKISYVGYKANNTGYSLTRVDTKGSAENETTHTTLSSITKYNGQRYVNYSNDGINKTTAYVSNDYSKNEYVADVRKISNESEYYIISEMLDIANDNQSYEDFQSLLGRWAATRVYMSCNTGSYDTIYESIDLQNEFDLTYKLSMIDGKYVLSIDISSTIEDVLTAPLGCLGDVFLIGNIDIVFNENNIVSLDFNYETNVTIQFSCQTLWGPGLEEGEGDLLGNFDYPEGSFIIETTVAKGKTSINFDYDFDNNFFNQSLEGYTGTGVNGAVENNVSNITIYTGNDEIGVVSIKVPYGQSLKTAVMNKMNTVLHGSKYEVYEMYVSEYFGELVTDATLVPSYDIDVYMVLSDTTVNEDPVHIVIWVVDSDLCIPITCWADEKIIDIVMYVLDLDQFELLGMYSDIDMQSAVDDDALVEDGKDVYVKVVEGWELAE